MLTDYQEIVWDSINAHSSSNREVVAREALFTLARADPNKREQGILNGYPEKKCNDLKSSASESAQEISKN